MEEHLLLTQTMMSKEIVKLTNDGVSPLSTTTCLITKEVNLTRNCFTVYPKDSTFPGSKEIDGAWLHGIRWIMNQLGVIKGVMRFEVNGVCRWL
jgi:uncharacterized protein involved in tellurium resistance